MIVQYNTVQYYIINNSRYSFNETSNQVLRTGVQVTNRNYDVGSNHLVVLL